MLGRACHIREGRVSAPRQAHGRIPATLEALGTSTYPCAPPLSPCAAAHQVLLRAVLLGKDDAAHRWLDLAQALEVGEERRKPAIGLIGPLTQRGQCTAQPL
eukprot:6375883-Prymnesium_polylepis.2